MILSRSTIIEISKEIQYICSQNVSHRISTTKYKNLATLVREINNLATSLEHVSIAGATALAKDATSDERQILTAFISQLPQGIVVCDALGTILLSNEQTRNYFNIKETSLRQGTLITTLMNKRFIEHGLDEINERLKKGAHDTSSHFNLRKGNHILQLQMVPVLTEREQFTGFVLIITDITQQSDTESRIEALLNTLSKTARSPLASIRAAVESMTEFPDMDSKRQLQFKEIIRKEAIILTDILNGVSTNYASLIKTKKSLKTILAPELLQTVARRAQKTLNIRVTVPKITSGEKIHLKVDPFSFVAILLLLLQKLKEETGIQQFQCDFSAEKHIANIDISWVGKPISAEQLRQWESIPLAKQESQIPHLTIQDVLSHHQAALGTYKDRATSHTPPCLRFFIPVQDAIEEPLQHRAMPESRSQLSDLELFSHSSQTPELDDRLLTELTYTSLIREINQAASLEEVLGKQSQLPRLIHSMSTSGTKIKTITWLVSAYADAILKKIIDLALLKLGPPPVPFAFLCLGSEGRNEQTLKTDQDNAIVFLDAENDMTNELHQQYFLHLGERVCTWLDQAGYDLCLGGIMAKTPEWCQPLSVWKRYFSNWLHTTKPENLLHATIFFDFRFAYGDSKISDELSDHLHQTLPGKTNFFSGMTISSRNFKPPIGIFGNFHLSNQKEYKKCINIKKAITPIVDFARIYSLYNNVRDNSTQDRLYQLYIKRVLSREDYNEIEQIYSFLMQIRFMGQIENVIRDKKPPHNYINPKHLSSIERRMLKEVLVNIKDIQARLCLEFTGTSNCQSS